MRRIIGACVLAGGLAGGAAIAAVGRDALGPAESAGPRAAAPGPSSALQFDAVVSATGDGPLIWFVGDLLPDEAEAYDVRLDLAFVSDGPVDGYSVAVIDAFARLRPDDDSPIQLGSVGQAACGLVSRVPGELLEAEGSAGGRIHAADDPALASYLVVDTAREAINLTTGEAIAGEWAVSVTITPIGGTP